MVELAEDDPLAGVQKYTLDPYEGSLRWGVQFPPTYLCGDRGQILKFEEPFSEIFGKYFTRSDNVTTYNPSFGRDLTVFLKEYYETQEWNLRLDMYSIPRELAIKRDELLKSLGWFCSDEKHKLIWPPQKGGYSPDFKSGKKELKKARKGPRDSVRFRRQSRR